MFGINCWRTVARTLLISGLLVSLLNLWGCSGSSTATSVEPPAPGAAPVKLAGKISEVSPPEAIQELRQVLEPYQPQVSIVAPRAGEVLQDDTVSVRLQVKDLPLFKDETLGLGPHLHVFLDNQPYQAVYDSSEPITFKELAPGTHTIRVFASRPWHESFKNDGAYAQTTFHVFTKNADNNPNLDLPLLTYSRPQGAYGAEPIMLDFYLTNAPLHIVAQEDDKDDVADWRIKVTVNGTSFVVDRWQPLYLKGFKPGKNWVQLDYIDEKGNSVGNVYNNTARTITYEPNGKDALSKLVRGDLSAAQARGIVDPNYKPGISEPTVAPAPIETPEVAPSPIETPTPPVVPIMPPVPEAKQEPVTPQEPAKPVTPPVPAKESPQDASEQEESQSASSKQAQQETPKGGFFNRFRGPAQRSNPSPVVPVPSPSVVPTPEATVEQPTLEPSPELTEEKPSETPPASQIEEAPKGFFNRFRRSPEPSKVSPTPELLPSPTPEPSPIASPSPTPEAEEPAPEPSETKSPEVAAPKPAPKSFFDRFRRSESRSNSVPVTPTPEQAIEPSEPLEVQPSEPAEIETPKASTPEPKSELERRLGIPLNPPITTPVQPTRPRPSEAEPKQLEPTELPETNLVKPLQSKKTSNQSPRSAPSSTPSSDAPIKLPETLEAPSEEAPSIPTLP